MLKMPRKSYEPGRIFICGHGKDHPNPHWKGLKAVEDKNKVALVDITQKSCKFSILVVQHSFLKSHSALNF